MGLRHQLSISQKHSDREAGYRSVVRCIPPMRGTISGHKQWVGRVTKNRAKLGSLEGLYGVLEISVVNVSVMSDSVKALIRHMDLIEAEQDYTNGF